MTERLHRGLHVVRRKNVYIRTKPQSWCIGTLYQDQEFDVQWDGEESGYVWGYALGNFKGHGWVEKGALKPKRHPAAGPYAPGLSHRHLSIHKYAGAHTLKDAPKHRLTIHVRLTHNAYMYGNYRNGKISDPRGHLIHARHDGKPNFVGWRYITKDGLFCMVRHEGLDLWGFIRTRRITMPVPNLYHHPEPAVIGLLPPFGWGAWPFGLGVAS